MGMNAQRPLAGVLWMVLVGAGLGLGFNAVHPNPLPWIAKPRPMIELPDSSNTTPYTSEGPLGDLSEMAPGDSAAPPATSTGVGSLPASPADKTPATTPGRGQVRPTDPDVPVGTAPPARDLYADLPKSEYLMEVGLARAKSLYDRGGLLVLDAREKADYDAGHIAGAESAPYDDVVGELSWLERLGSDPRPILAYCDGGECELSHDLASELTRAGHRRVMVLKDGYPAWEEAGYPVEKP
jgi:rhodanese-related sulfurtransferase